MVAKGRWTKLIAGLAATLLVLWAGCGPPTGGGGDDDDEDTGTATNDTGGNGGGDTTIDPFDTGGGGGDDTGGTDETGTPDDTSGDTGGQEDTQNYACTYFPDSCPDGQNCYPAMDGRGCADYDPSKSPGDSCTASQPNSCGDLQYCHPQETVCRKRCDPNADASNNACDQGDGCIELADQDGNSLGIGLCDPGCEEYPNDSCPSGENCYPAQGGGTVCAAYTQGKSPGDSCDLMDPTSCGKDQLCVDDGSGSGVCAAKCTSNGDGPCSASDCQENFQVVDYGVCPPP